jgi:hypothetical protein
MGGARTLLHLDGLQTAYVNQLTLACSKLRSARLNGSSYLYWRFTVPFVLSMELKAAIPGAEGAELIGGTPRMRQNACADRSKVPNRAFGRSPGYPGSTVAGGRASCHMRNFYLLERLKRSER